MTQTEPITSTENIQVAANDAVFSPVTRENALSIIRKKYNISFLWPIRDGIEWILNIPVEPGEYSSVIEARQRFNQAANDAAIQTEQEKKAA